MRRVHVLAVVAVMAASLLAGVAAASVWAVPASAAPTVGSRYVPLAAPVRVLDTRTTKGGHLGKIGPHGTVSFTATAAGLPAETAVALNLTVVGASAAGFVTAYPAGTATPSVSSLNFAKGTTRANAAVVQVPSSQQVTVYNGSLGTIDLIADLSGAFTGTSGEAAGTFVPMAPIRLLDTRTATGGHQAAVASRTAMSFPVGGKAGIPADASAAILNLTVTATKAAGYETAFPYDTSLPGASTLNFGAGQTVANLAVVPLGSQGRVSLYNGSSGSAQFLADVAGYFVGGVPATQGALGTLAPTRVLDTSTAVGGHDRPVGKSETVTLPVTGRAGVPTKDVAAVVINVSVASPATNGNVTVYGGGSRPNASNLNFVKGQTVANLVVAAPDASGNLHISNNSTGTLRLIVDISGYLITSDLSAPTVSVGHYLRNLSGGSADASTMSALGAADTHAGSKLVVLDVGAQTRTKLASPGGVALTGFSDADPRRLTYAQLTSALNAYLASFTVSGATVAIATNNDGDWTGYVASDRGLDWWNHVISLLTPASGVTVVAADDIEYGFISTAPQALTWETAYLDAAKGTATPARPRRLLFIGDANDCPIAFGSTASCSWTQAQEYQLAGGQAPTLIQALPQIYTRSDALKWANVDRTGGSKINFLGSLSEHAADPSGSVIPQQSYAALWNALSAVGVTAPAAVTDLDAQT